jgi:hypothetical protein
VQCLGHTEDTDRRSAGGAGATVRSGGAETDVWH